jgi:putative FmdB family regulatory protein
MPIYEYECIPNKHRFEVIQKFNDPPVTHCTVCGEPVQKLLSSPAIQFKGSGWYITDYARKGKGESDSSAGSSKTAESAKSTTAETKDSGKDAGGTKSSEKKD